MSLVASKDDEPFLLWSIWYGHPAMQMPTLFFMFYVFWACTPHMVWNSFLHTHKKSNVDELDCEMGSFTNTWLLMTSQKVDNIFFCQSIGLNTRHHGHLLIARPSTNDLGQ